MGSGEQMTPLEELAQVRDATAARDAERKAWNDQIEIQRRQKVAKTLRSGDGWMLGCCLCNQCCLAMLAEQLPDPRSCERTRAWAEADRPTAPVGELDL